MSKRWVTSLAVAALAAAPATAEKLGKAERAAIAATPEQVAAAVTVTDDPLDLKIRIDSRAFGQRRPGLFEFGASNDVWLRATIDRKTGRMTLQLVAWYEHSMDWQMWNRAVAEGPSGPLALEGTALDSDVSCGRYGCTKTEAVAVDVPEDLLRWVAAGASPGTDVRWQFKFYGRSAEGEAGSMLKTEAAGFLLALARARARVAVR